MNHQSGAVERISSTANHISSDCFTPDARLVDV